MQPWRRPHFIFIPSDDHGHWMRGRRTGDNPISSKLFSQRRKICLSTERLKKSLKKRRTQHTHIHRKEIWRDMSKGLMGEGERGSIGMRYREERGGEREKRRGRGRKGGRLRERERKG